MEADLSPIDIDAPFTFACHPGVPCFNACCRELNQFLTPYDIIRLKRHLGLSSGEFLSRYTRQHIGPETGLPVMVLRQDASQGMTCPFLTEKGCGVYPARPASCRSYPLARMATRCRETGRITEHYAVLREPHCHGFQEDTEQTVRQWIAAQELAAYNEMNDMLMEIIGLKMRLHPTPLDFREQHMFHLACYDLDTFRAQILDTVAIGELSVEAGLKEKARSDDEALLRLSMAWLKKVLFDVE